MSDPWTPHPWVAQHQQEPGFALQVFPVDTKDDPARKMLAAGRLAESLGFDAFIVSDHPAWGLECWMHLAALATMTSTIRLGTGVVCTSYRHPVMLARQAADLDNLSDGRLLLGIGCGWDANEFANLGLPFPPVRDRQAALVEAIAIMRGVWGPEPFTFAGDHLQTTNARVTPPPRQQPGPPVLIAGGGERTTLAQVARYGDACQLGSFGQISGDSSAESVRHKLEVLRRHCAALGRPDDTVLRTHYTGWLVLAEDEDRLRQKARRYFPDGVDRRYAGPWQGFALTATVDQAIATYRALIQAGIQYVMFGTLDAGDVETIHLLADAVIPALRNTTPPAAAR